MAEELKIVIDAEVDKALAEFKKFEKSISGLATGSIAQLTKAAAFLKTQLANLSPEALRSDFGRQLSEALKTVQYQIKQVGIESGITEAKSEKLFSKITNQVKGLASVIPGLAIGAVIGFATDFIKEFATEILNAGNAAEETKNKFRSFGDVVSDSTASVQGDIAKVNALAAAFKDTSSLEGQKRILGELKGISESYFGELKAGKTTYEEIAKAANLYTEALISQAVVKGLTDEISKVSTELAKAKRSYKEAAIASSNYNERLKAIRDLPEREHQRSIAFTTLALEKQLNTVVGLQTEFNQLSSEVQGAVNESLKFKLPGGKLDPIPKDQTDAIIARAKAFIKEFSGVFVFPDLEVSFTNTKDKVLAAAKKLLSDIEKGLLQLKLLERPREINIPIELGLQVDEKGIANDIQKIRDNLFKDANIFGDKTKIIKGIVPGVSDDVSKRNKEFFDAFQKQILATSQLVTDILAPAFDGLFDAIVAGENPLKAFFKGIEQSVNQLIKKLIAAAIQAAVLSALSGGASGSLGGFGNIFSKLLGFGGRANFSGAGLGGAIGGQAFSNVLNVNVMGVVSGDNIRLVQQRAANSAGRFG